METAIFSGGCFWCTEAVFGQLNGVSKVKPGFSGGHVKNPSYKEVITQKTGHAESIHITFDPKEISYLKLLEVFFATHDPTSLNRQGEDIGTHYRSAIFYNTPEQRNQAEEYINFLTKKNVFDKPIVTELNEFDVFYDAENYHNDYYEQNKEQSYCQFVINPKIEKFKDEFKEYLK